MEGYRNYDKSEFDTPSQLFNGDDKKLEGVYKQLQPLKDFVDPKNYKSYAELQKKLTEVLGEQAHGPRTAEEVSQESAPLNAPSPAAEPESGPTEEIPSGAAEGEPEPGTMAYFAKLANS